MCLSASLFLAVPTPAALPQPRSQAPQNARANAAYQRGYPSGYSDGFTAGRAAYRERLNHDFRSATAYQRAERGYRTSAGDRQDFQAGYRLGYELGYLDGYYGRSYSLRLPNNALALHKLTEARRGNGDTKNGSVQLSSGTKLSLRLNTTINTQTSRPGDMFTASVVSPQEYEGAFVEGHIAQLKRSERVTGMTELTLTFDAITLRNGRNGMLRGEVKELLANESVKAVDEEGNLESVSKTKDSALNTGSGAALDAIINTTTGGGKGAAIGALIGGGVSAGSIYIQGKQDLLLEPGAQLVMEVARSHNSTPPQ
jgi:hypothetical protein